METKCCANCAHLDKLNGTEYLCGRDTENVIEVHQNHFCDQWQAKMCRHCGYYFDPFGDCANIALCSCYDKCIYGDFAEIPKDKQADDCDKYYYDPQED